MQEAAQRAMDRPQFVIDDVAEGDDEGDYGGIDGNDADLMNQVDKMLIEEEQGLTGDAAQNGQGKSDASDPYARN